MKKTKRFLLFVACWACTSALVAQDFMFSQQQNLPHLTNPAFTGLIPEMSAHRVAMGYRGIWETPWEGGAQYGYAVAYDHRRCVGRSFWAFGLSAQMDVAHFGGGVGSAFQNQRVNLLAAYHQRLANNLTLAVGAGAGIIQYGLDPSVLRFDRQFDPQTGFNAAADKGEAFGDSRLSRVRPDLDAGLLLYQNESPFGNRGIDAWSAGLSVHHILRPVYSFFDDENRLHTGFSLQGNLLFLDKKLLVTGLFRRQSFSESRQWQVVAGGVWKRLFKSSSQGFQVSPGLLMRLSGRYVGGPVAALTPYLAIGFDSNWTVGIGHDLSLARTVNRFYGGFELTLRMRFGEVGGTRCIACPD